MTQPSHIERLERFSSASPITQALYDDGVILRNIFSRYDLPENIYSNYAIAIGDIMLGFYPKSELPNLLNQIYRFDEVVLFRITADLYEVLKKLDNATSPRPSTGLSSDITETENALAQVTPLRTMTRDMSNLQGQLPPQETVYRSEQPILATKNIKPLPPQWENSAR